MKRIVFLCHEGVSPNSLHQNCLIFCNDLMDQSQHIKKILNRLSAEIITNNCLQLNTSIDAIR